MRKAKSRSPDAVMLAFLLLISLLVAAISGWSLWQSWQHSVEETERQARNQSISLARQAEDTFLQVQLTLDELIRRSDEIFLHPADWNGLRGQLAQQQRQLPQLHGLFVYDAHGDWLATSGSYIPARANNADREYFIWHSQHSDPGIHIGHVLRSRSTGDLVVPVSMRLDNREGRFRGVLLATVKLDYFRQFYGYYEMGPSDTLGITFIDSTVLYVRPFPDSYINRTLSSSPLFTRMLKIAPTGGGAWKSAIDGVPRIFGYATLARYPLVVSAGYDITRLRDAWWRNNIPTVALNAILLGVVLIFGVLVLRQIRASLRYQKELIVLRDDLTRSNHILQDLALLDGLTGLANRRQFDIYLEQCIERARRTGVPVSLVMCDVDYFKSYNDTLGHVAGDECLTAVGEILRYLPLRNTDRVARYGGEEFAIILPGADTHAAQRVALRALEAVHHARLSHPGTPMADKILTISAGAATVDGENADIETLKNKADEALYQAKRAGRNCVVGEAGVTHLLRDVPSQA
ncbi:Diguanylate cyclase/phosphodiesterase domain 1 (GGDEF) [Cronobacter condimenti 1330]|uniref:diguanylate cyclase n=1 Tax=Cronobacter condimenti 1330 TaxID=1073999 RepID=K8A0X5_9ENTR|nr:sensor domain-containing diguanylate cyclase [Cronobacter condimenti]ALB64414.1 cellulose synthase [Cronobacter condimenti 1330]CCJ72515.1 Diguanylate cyclase/phosphodiesterase domain 1 (GGDEF) [Cronobacter condimenti 1330]